MPELTALKGKITCRSYEIIPFKVDGRLDMLTRSHEGSVRNTFSFVSDPAHQGGGGGGGRRGAAGRGVLLQTHTPP